MYLTYDEYRAYGGTLSNADFDRYCFRAACEIDNNTQGRCKTLSVIPESVKRCAYELVLYISKNSNNGSVNNVTSFSNDGYSVSYAEQKTAEKQIYDIIYTYLADTGLLYCGVE